MKTVRPSTYRVGIAAETSIWFGAVLHGDECTIHIGRKTNIQDDVLPFAKNSEHLKCQVALARSQPINARDHLSFSPVI